MSDYSNNFRDGEHSASPETKAAFLQTAHYKWQSDDDVSIDIDASVTVCEEGAWVAAWVWVPNDEVPK